MPNQQITSLLHSLNTNITDHYLANTAKAAVETFIRTEIETAFGITQAIKDAEYKDIDSQKLKSLYYSLSREFHPDGFRRKNPELSAILAKKDGYDRLPQAMLSEVWQEITRERYIHPIEDTASTFDIDTYHPLYFINKRIDLLGTIFTQIRTELTENEELKQLCNQKAAASFVHKQAAESEKIAREKMNALETAETEVPEGLDSALQAEVLNAWLSASEAEQEAQTSLDAAEAAENEKIQSIIINQICGVIRHHFPELYAYEACSDEWQQNHIYYFASVLNTILICAGITTFAIDMVRFIYDHHITNPLLSVATQNRHIQYGAQIMAMKLQLLSLGIAIEKLLDDKEVENIYHHHQATYPERQKAILASAGIDIETRSEIELTILFKKHYVLTQLTENLENLSQDPSLSELDKHIKSHDITLEKAMNGTTLIDAEIIAAYDRIREIEAHSLQKLSFFIFSIRVSSLKKLYITAYAMKDMLSDDAQPLLDRILKTILFMAVTPLFLISCMHQALTETSYALLVAIKLLSAECTTACLKASAYTYSFFSQCASMFSDLSTADNKLALVPYSLN